MKLVGCFALGPRNVELCANPGEYGGSFTLAPKTGGLSRMTIGVKADHWWEVLEVLLHEAMELALCDIGARFKPNLGWANASDTYVFQFDHNQFSEAVARATCFVSESQNGLARLHRQAVAARKARK